MMKDYDSAHKKNYTSLHSCCHSEGIFFNTGQFLQRVTRFLLNDSAWKLCILLFAASAHAQFPWPVTPFNQSQISTGTFCEYRDTAPAPHYHNGADIPKDDGSPVYAVHDAVITAIDPNGSNAYVRAGLFAYVHIMPNPALGVGDSVFKSVTVLGTILSGLGHVHLTEGEFNSEVNALRENTGLTPHIDSWPPVINSVRFFQSGSGREFTSNSLSGPIDIVANIAEKSGPPGSSASQLNNGIYKLGYKILSADRSAIVYSPPNNGLRYQFDRKPLSDVHYTFHPNFSSTTTHVYYVNNTASAPSAWDTAALPEGNYTVMIFTEDTKRNADTAYVAVQVTRKDLLAPARPLLLSITAPTTPLARWQVNTEADLNGYRLYSSSDNNVWRLFQDETVLLKGSTNANLDGASENYFRLTAVDTVAPPNESAHSDVYGFAPSPRAERILIVDGFDRFGGSGSWAQPWHSFVFMHGRAIAANGFAFESCANEQIISGAINLQDYEAVFWLLGDESTTDETFNATEQARVKTYLQNGGKLFVSGSEIAWDLDTAARGSASDEAFLRDYLKADYVSDDANSFSVTGASEGIFANLNFTYGSTPYQEDFPDALNAVNGGVVCLRYSNGQNAGVQFDGIFPGGASAGKLVYFGFPFETISSTLVRQEVVRRVLEFFFPSGNAVAERSGAGELPQQFVLLQNYPNPFHSGAQSQTNGVATKFRFGLPEHARVRWEIFDVLGRRVYVSVEKNFAAGFHEAIWEGRDQAGSLLASGRYFFRMIAENANKEKFVREVQLSLIK